MFEETSEVCEFEIYTFKNEKRKFGIYAPNCKGKNKWLSMNKHIFNSKKITMLSKWNIIIHEYGFTSPPQIKFKQILTNHAPEPGSSNDSPSDKISTLIGNMMRKVNESQYKNITTLNMKDALSSCQPSDAASSGRPSDAFSSGRRSDGHASLQN